MIRAYHQPRRLEEALDLVAKGALPLAGGTSIYTAKNERDVALVDLAGLGLDAISYGVDAIEIGATVTLSRLAAAVQLPGMPGALLRRGARAVASLPMRNMVTVGGNIAHFAYWADLPPVLLALDAQVEVTRPGGATKLPMAEFLKMGSRALDGGLITKVTVPLAEGTFGFGYERFSRTAIDYSFATVVATARRDGQSARDVRLSVGALQGRPFRVAEAEALLEGQPFERHVVEAAAQKLAEVVPVAPNFRVSSEYRRELAGTLARRALTTAFTWMLREL